MISQMNQLKKYKISPKKRLGQNFLLDEEIQENIISFCEFTQDDSVVEIGAGLGALTTKLAPKVKEVFAVELDTQLADLLKRRIVQHENVHVMNHDILSLDVSRFTRNNNERLKILGNIPYNISSPLIFKLLESSVFLSMAVLMFQKEVADRIVARPGTKSYGVLSVFCQVNAAVSRELVVPQYHFYPQPKVNSAIVKFVFFKTPLMDIKDERVFRRIVKTAFAQRRKTLKNTLKNSLGFDIPFEKVLRALKKCEIDPQRRGETLNLNEFRELSNYLSE
ncbi:MAG: 16S rRNA (adenine(1518)-N(6)/adenine(1519)-N(6))-dimethyltransferase RsmA [Thermodesulfobacteriota bacterium]|nr:16S rRNA (adenine(1518)-N(6)/adenine(1519)-N(6))-dimethyltransferase RsmA [Thermodesulfobacteriota bacterium]